MEVIDKSADLLSIDLQYEEGVSNSPKGRFGSLFAKLLSESNVFHKKLTKKDGPVNDLPGVRRVHRVEQSSH